MTDEEKLAEILARHGAAKKALRKRFAPVRLTISKETVNDMPNFVIRADDDVPQHGTTLDVLTYFYRAGGDCEFLIGLAERLQRENDQLQGFLADKIEDSDTVRAVRDGAIYEGRREMRGEAVAAFDEWLEAPWDDDDDAHYGDLEEMRRALLALPLTKETP
jgi:hypothetical protein